jgi:hypothetical protein
MNNLIVKPKKKRFNVTGNCYPHLHYMMDISAKMKKVDELIDYGDYFTISRPRQYGKTTLLFAIEDKLKNSEEYLPILLNFQGLDEKADVSDSSFAFFVKELIEEKLHSSKSELYSISKETQINNTLDLSRFFTKLVTHSDKKIVLIIDEVDASSNYLPFLKFLSVLRAKYLNRFSPSDYTFHSVILAGVHDVKSLKYKIKSSEDLQYNSPWNIAVDFKVPMEFNPQEIKPMLVDYNQAENRGMNENELEQIAKKLYEYTSGYPFLVSRLCQIMVEDILPTKIEENLEQDNQKWTLEDLEKAFFLIQRESNTNFESLIKNLQNNQDLYNLVSDMLLECRKVSFNIYNEVIEKGVMYGVFKQNGQVKINNLIYEQIIYNYLISKVENQTMQPYLTEHKFILPNKELNFQLILERFQVYMKETYSQKEESFLENQWRLIFLAFLRPILNGNGYEFKEVQISDEKRIDVVVTYHQHKYIIELKIWRGESYHERGILQLYDYLEKQNKDIGYLIIFDNRKENKNTLKSEWIEIEKKKIFMVWV